ncbi:hypothetical protein [Gemmatimonas sp.]|uniref:hypothetical protein n=1 Tax=Gemmatimonas sp. TaxID=1962908 RepID=UPI003983D6E9
MPHVFPVRSLVRHLWRRASALGLGLSAVLASGCAAAIPVGAPVSPTTAAAPGGAPTTPLAQPALRWPVRTVEHIDLWLHAFALISEDTTRVRLYRNGYRDSLVVVKNQRNVLTSLDANRATLARRLPLAGGYLSAQFLPFEFSNWDAMKYAIERFLQFEGDPRRAPDRETQARVAMLASMFPGAADREWLRLFLAGVIDEQERFFNAEHSRVIRTRAPVITSVDSLWQQVYRVKFERFLNNTSQRQGDLLLSLPIGGEGRTAAGPNRQTMVAVPFPARSQDAVHVLYVLAHEVTGTLVGSVVSDNTTPAEQRAGVADRYVSIGQVQAGAMLLAIIAPELRDGYVRFYVEQANIRSSRTTAYNALFDTGFALPPAIREAIQRQIDIILSGI